MRFTNLGKSPDSDEEMEANEEEAQPYRTKESIKPPSQVNEQAPINAVLHFSQTSMLDTTPQAQQKKTKPNPITAHPGGKRHSRPAIAVERPGPKIGYDRKGDKAYQCVGLLRGIVYHQPLKIRIELGKVFKIGRGTDADLQIRSRTVSKIHLRIYTYRTTTQHSLICIHDLSNNGYILNGTRQRATKAVKVNGTRYTQRATILRDGNTIQLPGCKAVLTLHMNTKHLPENTNISQTYRPTPIFQEIIKKTYPLPPFTIHNHPLGDGTYGVVTLATLTSDRSNTQFACKTTLLASLQTREINSEVTILKRLSHPNVLGLVALIEEEKRGRMHLIQELATGGDLFAYIEVNSRGLKEDEVRFLAWQMVEGLRYLHGIGIVHRDIKPENILLQISSSYPRVFIADFGHAMEYETLLNQVPTSTTQLDQMMASPIPVDNIGTSNYLPPERLYGLMGYGPALISRGEMGGRKKIGSVKAKREGLARDLMEREKQLDMWSLGCVLYFCASGSHPYDTNTEMSLEGVYVPLPEEKVRPSQMIMKTSNIRGATQDDVNEKDITALSKEFEKSRMGGSVGGEESSSAPDLAARLSMRKILGLMLAFGRLSVDEWCPRRQWYGYSPECKHFIASLMEEDESLRMGMDEIKKHQWMINAEKEKIGDTYDWVVVEGQSLIKE